MYNLFMQVQFILVCIAMSVLSYKFHFAMQFIVICLWLIDVPQLYTSGNLILCFDTNSVDLTTGKEEEMNSVMYIKVQYFSVLRS